MYRSRCTSWFGVFSGVLLFASGSFSGAWAQKISHSSPTPSPSPSVSPKVSVKKSKPKSVQKIPEELEALERNYLKEKTLYAKFDQTTESAALGRRTKSSGVIMVKQPNKIRWETQSPDQSTLVTNGKTFWFYTPPFDETERGQVIEKKTVKVQSRLLNTLLAGAFSKSSKDMSIQSGSQPGEYILKPKEGAAGGVIKATIHLDPAQHVLDSVVIEHRDGNRSELKLSGVELGKSLVDDLFAFVPPPNTDVIRE